MGRVASLTLALSLVLPLAACSASPNDPAPSPTASAAPTDPADQHPELLLFTSLPIYWNEGGLGDLLSAEAAPHWARTALESRYALRPVDRLVDLPAGGTILMAQPRALAGDENVALDNWVREGGRVLLFADPMLDVHSAYGLGDRRRPEAMAMLSPILGRWGLKMSYDPDQDEGVRIAKVEDFAIPVADAGVLTATGAGHESECAVIGTGANRGLLAHCHVGRGQVLVLADAELVADGDHAGEGAETALFGLLDAVRRP